MSNNRNLGNIATAITNATSGQVLTSQGSGVATFADAGGTGVTVHANQAAMLTDAASADEGSLHYETTNNKLYVKQSSGFFLLASITNTAPTVSGFTETTGSGSATTIADNGTFALTSGSNTVITLTATEPDLETLVYSATVTSGTASNVISSPSLPISNQSGNTFTLTPVTSGSGGTITIRFDVSDGNNVVNKTHSFSIVFKVVDSKYTTLLATATSTGGNSTIEDSSTANSGSGHNITVNGDAYAGTFSPYRSGGYSWDFDGSTSNDSSTSRITATPSSTLSLGTGDYTVEMWVKSRSSTSIQSNGNYRLFEVANSSGGERIAIRDNGYGDSRFSVMENGSQLYRTSSGTNPYTGEWEWLQIVRDNGATKAYVNGSERGSASSTTDISGINKIYIGSAGTSGIGYGFNGNIRDFRISNIARSTTVPTEPLESDSNTLILACNKGYLVDQGPNSIPLALSSSSNKSDPAASTTSPYDYTEYSATDHGGSVYFDGNGDSLNTSTTQIIPSTSFTVTAWVYLNDTTDGAVWGQGTSGHSGRTGITIDSGNWFSQIGSTQLGTSTSVSANIWYYTDLQWDGSTLKFFVNGSLIGSSNTSNSPTNSALYIGDLGSAWSPGYPLNGYVSDLKVVSGTPSGSSTVPTAPRSSSGASLHIKGTDASIIDKSQGSNLKLVGNTTGSTTTNFTGAKSMYFDGNGDYADTTIEPIGAEDFTVEFWVNDDGSGSSQQKEFGGYLSLASGGSQSTGIFFSRYNFMVGGNSTLWGTAFPNTFTAEHGTGWSHIAMCRSGTTVKVYVDGTLEHTVTGVSSNLTNTDLRIASRWNDNTSYLCPCYIQDLRISKGKARYTANFTPLSAPLEG